MKITDSMWALPNDLVKGDIIGLKTTREGHQNGLPLAANVENPAGSFAEALNKAFALVNDQQITAEELATRMATDPASVDAHTVMIAGEKARISLTFAKAVADSAVKTYRELTNLR